MRLRCAPFAVLAACLTGCGGPAGGVRVEGPALTAIPWSGPAYMTDWYGRAWQHPTEVDPVGRIVLSRLTWRDWGSPQARATGEATDETCLSGCPGGHPPSFRVTVLLSDLVKRGGVAFYGHMRLIPLHPPAPSWTEGRDDTDLDVPST
ncbi:hypothetical protein [Streptomyces alanosinicus]|uniref:Uncharacterized protein n=1 Tax=Streptomyces alanosinicus TaxID=68171 RepID=A0A919D560_9ACTN|nr:hypothetical protein [Streptomyces alanosinicus]GHE08908.1 hypothetical protein GCM10010339_59370 [Streptomyces alanosinicus]